jgi:hypothetical protein
MGISCPRLYVRLTGFSLVHEDTRAIRQTQQR